MAFGAKQSTIDNLQQDLAAARIENNHLRAELVDATRTGHIADLAREALHDPTFQATVED